MNILLRYFSLSKSTLYLGILLMNFVVIWLSQNFLINEIVFYNTYSEQLTVDRSLQLFESVKKVSWISYVFLPIMLFIKFTLISIVIYIGIFFYNLYEKVAFGRVFKTVIGSEIIIVIASLTKFLWLYLFGGNYDLNDIGFFYPLSLINLFNISEVDKIWVYPLQIVNLYQVVYIIALSFGLRKVCNIGESESDKIVLSSYMPALVVWIALIMFISIDTAI